ncbi:GDSL-type esterase/lipase family protein [Epibacterium ulvae]|uniref:GDSL-type esterase/lipase family protein n=1 Tax=Epibacterium ulvae TaxID=1156985 RepID=UPI00249386A6|nr:GDSL-type esterase/lipase family protein [Epibacterium ulvae]
MTNPFETPSGPDIARLIFIGASTTEGMGDNDHIGWPLRITQDLPYTTGIYNLGIRGQTIFQIAKRAKSEIGDRVLSYDQSRIVLGAALNEIARYGNDTRDPRFDPDDILHSYRDVIDRLVQMAPLLVVGPPPVRAAQMPFFSQLNQCWFDYQAKDISWLDDELHKICKEKELPYISILGPLGADQAYMSGLKQRDGLHSDAAGYVSLANIVGADEQWRRFIYP